MSSSKATEKAQIAATLASYTLSPVSPPSSSRPGLGHTRTRSNPPPGLSITPAPYRPAINVSNASTGTTIVTIGTSTTTTQAVPRPKSTGLGPKNERLWNPQDDAYWAHLRDMWATSPSPPPSETAHTLEGDSDVDELMDEVDLRSARAIQKEFRVQLPSRINEQTRAANALRVNGGVGATAGYMEKGRLAPPPPPPPYTRRPSQNERSLSGLHAVEEKEPVGTATTKYLFWIGFVFPLTWLMGTIILLTRLRLPTSASSPSSTERGTNGNAKRIVTTKGSITIISGPTREEIKEREELKWGKRCGCAAILSLIVYGLTVIMLLVVLPKVKANQNA